MGVWGEGQHKFSVGVDKGEGPDQHCPLEFSAMLPMF